jgi:uncharacterized protein (TIGR02271 family)
MALYKLEEFYPNYQEELFDGDDIKGLDVYAGRTGEKIGTIDSALVDESGRLRYFVIDTGFWIFGKKVLLPVGYCQIDDRARRIYATGLLNKKQAEELPEYNDSTRVNRKYEERVRDVYLTGAAGASVSSATEYVAPVDKSVSLEASAPLDSEYSASRAISAQASNATYDHDTYNYKQEPSVYDLNPRDHQTLKLYEERLVANKKRRQTGEVVVGKHVETETARVSLPVEKERVVIERTTPTDAGTIASPRNLDFRERELARMKLYEETADIHKEAFVREEVRIRKEVERDTVEAEETLRREELDIDTDGRRVVDRRFDRR